MDDAQKLARVDAINQVFTLFRLNFHNQYLKAFGNREELNEVKRLWLEMLQRFSAEAILRGAKTVIENSEYLPTLHTMIHACERASSSQGIPDAHQAYVEACRAPSPKAAYAWSHPIVYYAGRQCDWYFLQSSSESLAYPVFKKHYDTLLAQLRSGVEFDPPQPAGLPDTVAPPLDKEAGLDRLSRIREKLNL